MLDLSGVTVDPHQFLGIELNPRAAAIAEMVLWIGHLQWHFRTRGHVMPPQPVLKDFHNIECRDAVLAHDGEEFVFDDRGLPITRWDGRTTKTHPVTGEQVPDDRARTPLYRYKNPRKAEWPAADFVGGEPAIYRDQADETGAGRGLYGSLANYLVGGARVGRPRHVLVGARGAASCFTAAWSIRLHNDQQPDADLQSSCARTPLKRRI